jgi:hypothetical protein
MRSLQLLASRVAAAVAREARQGGATATASSTRAAATTASTKTTTTKTPPPPPIVTVRGLDAGAADADAATSTQKTARRAESVALLRQLNVAALPQLRGQTILARVVRASRHELLLDPGYYGLCAVPRAGVMPAAAAGGDGSSSAPSPSSSSPADAAAGPTSPVANTSQVRAGDYVRVRLAELYTPYGDPQLDPVRTPRSARDKLVWRELARRMRQGAPVLGRVLNACPGGYSVGVGGYVALLRTEQAPAEVVRAVGVLQPFYVHKMSHGGGKGAASGQGEEGSGGAGAGRGRKRRGAADAQRQLIELTCTIQRGGGDGSGGLYTNV